MRRACLIRFALAAVCLGLVSFAYGRQGAIVHSRDDFRVEVQTSGPVLVHSYLLYDIRRKEAALIDAGSAIDQLLATVESLGLNLRYVLLTHAHQDHVAGLPALRRKYPQARLACSRAEYADIKDYQGWRTLFQAASVALWDKNPAMRVLMDFDYAGLPEPDIWLGDGQELHLGARTIKALNTPGHSRGGVTFAVDDAVFPGDLILYHRTGYMDYSLASRDRIVESIRKLYAAFPDATRILSGHGEPSTIGFEKANNQNVTEGGVKWAP